MCSLRQSEDKKAGRKLKNKNTENRDFKDFRITDKFKIPVIINC